MIYEPIREPPYMPRTYPEIGPNIPFGTPPHNPFGPVPSIREPNNPVRIYDPEMPSIGTPSRTYIRC